MGVGEQGGAHQRGDAVLLRRPRARLASLAVAHRGGDLRGTHARVRLHLPVRVSCPRFGLVGLVLRGALHISVISLAPRQYTLRRYTSPVAGTVTVRLPFAGRLAGATLHTPGAELQLVTPSPRAKPGLAVAGATPSSANQSIATNRRRLHSHIDSSSQRRTSAGLTLQRILQRCEVMLQ